MAWWPWRRPGGEPVPAVGAPAPAEQPTAPVQRSAEWAELPPLQRVLEQTVAPVAPLDVFRANLATSRDPSFLAPLTHRVDPAAGGLVEGIAGVAAPLVHPVGPDLPVLPRPSAPAPRVQRRVGSWSSPVEAAVPAPASVYEPGAEPGAEPQPALAEPEALPQTVPAEQLAAPVAVAQAVVAQGASAVAQGAVPPAVVAQRAVPPAVVAQRAVSATVTPQAVTPETSQAETPVEPEPMRVLAVVVPPEPPRAERPTLPLAQLPVVSRMTTAPAAARPPTGLPVTSGAASTLAARDDASPAVTTVEVPVTTRTDEAAAPAAAGSAPADPPGSRSEQQERTAPLSGFAAAIAAIDRDDLAAPGASVRPEPAAPDAMPVQRSAVGAPRPEGRLSRPVVPAAALPPAPVGPAPVGPAWVGPAPVGPAPVGPAPAAPGPVVESAGPAPLIAEPVASESVSAGEGLDEGPGTSQDQPLLGGQPLATGADEPVGGPSIDLGSSDDPELSHAHSAEPTTHDPASGEWGLPALPVVSRAVDPGAARAAEPTPTATLADAPTLGTPTPGAPASRPSATARPVTSSPVLQRQADVVPAQPVRFLPVEAAGPSRSVTNPSRGSAAEPRAGSGPGPLPAATTVAPRGAGPSPVPPVPAAPPADRDPARPAVALQRWTELVGSARPSASAPVSPASRPLRPSEPAAVLQRLVDEPYLPAVVAGATGTHGSTAGSTAGRTVTSSVTAPPVVLRQTASALFTRPGLPAPPGPHAPTAPSPAALLTMPSRGTSFTQMFSPSPTGASADGGVPGVQRDVAPESPPAEPAPAVPASSDPPATGSAPSLSGGTAATTAAAAAAAPVTDVEDLARRLYEPLSARLRAELWLDRERAGV